MDSIFGINVAHDVPRAKWRTNISMPLAAMVSEVKLYKNFTYSNCFKFWLVLLILIYRYK